VTRGLKSLARIEGRHNDVYNLPWGLVIQPPGARLPLTCGFPVRAAGTIRRAARRQLWWPAGSVVWPGHRGAARVHASGRHPGRRRLSRTYRVMPF